MKKTTNDRPSMTTRKLSIPKQTLRVLGQNELAQAAGGAATPTLFNCRP
jgi:hypothetical protein